MKRIRFNIASLLVVIFILGVGFAALRESNDTWDSSVFTITLVVLLISIMLAVHRAEQRRAFWLGFALFGSAYLGLSLVPSIEPRLITTKALDYLDSKVPGRPTAVLNVLFSATIPGGPSNQAQVVAFDQNGNRIATASQGAVRLWNATTGKVLSGWSGTTENFVRIGHSLFALIAAFLGGQLSRRLYRSSIHPEISTTVESGGSPV
jgi:WD40 repeat protein